MRVKINENITLYHGDCRDIVPDVVFDSVVTDPPYGMSYVSNHRTTKYEPIVNDDTTDLLRYACDIKAPHSNYVFCRWDNLYDVPKPTSFITWVKNNHSMGDLKHSHARKTETLLFYSGANHFFPTKRPTDVVNHARTQNKNHPTEKPIELMEEILGWTDGVVLDPFMGSGATAVAAAKLGRKFIGVELNRGFFDIAVRRVREALA